MPLPIPRKGVDMGAVPCWSPARIVDSSFDTCICLPERRGASCRRSPPFAVSAVEKGCSGLPHAIFEDEKKLHRGFIF